MQTLGVTNGLSFLQECAVVNLTSHGTLSCWRVKANRENEMLTLDFHSGYH